MQQMTHETLDTGLGSFRDSSPDYILAPVGLASMQDQAQKLAEYGRNGDVYIVHAAQGETVIPLEVLNANPKVKGLLYKQMRDMGLDPKEFVVGDELNSINPVTGLPEFFFKKIFRAVKKVVKKVVNVAKKIAPIALPLIAATFGFPFLGTAFKAGSFASSALAGGLGTLAQGGSFKDALKSGLLQGGIASLAGCLKTLGTGESFMSGVGRSFTGAGAPSWQTQWWRLQGGELGDLLLAKPEDSLSINKVGLSAELPSFELADVDVDNPYWNPETMSIQENIYQGPDYSIPKKILPGSKQTFSHANDINRYLKKKVPGKSFLDTASDFFFPKDASQSVIDEKAAELIRKHRTLYGGKGGVDRAVAAAKAELNPNVVRKWVGPVAGGLGVAGALGAFDEPDVDQPEGHPPYVNPEWDLAREEGESDADYDARLK